MSQDNVDVVRRGVQSALTDPEAFFSILDPDVEWDSRVMLPDSKIYRGPEGVREFFRHWIGPFDDFGYDVEEITDAGDSVILLVHQWGPRKRKRPGGR